MPHPTDIPSFQTAVGAVVVANLPEDARAPFEVAQASPIVVTMSGLVVDALKAHVADLDADAANALAGAAHLLLTNHWLGRAAEADTVRDAARARLAALG